MTDSGMSAELAPEQLTALLRISRALAAHRDRSSLFAAIAEAVEGLLPAERVVVLVPEIDGAAVSIYAVHGAVKLFEGERVPDDSVASWVMQRREPLFAARAALRARFPPTYERLVAEGMESIAALPLLGHAGCLGVIGFLAPTADAFASCPRRLLDEVARSVAVALEGCIAYERLQRLDRERAALLEVNAAVGRHLERDELFGALARCLRELVPTERFGIELPIEGDRLQGHLLTPRGAGAEPTRPTVLPAAGTACDWVLRNRQWMVTATRDELRERFPITYDVMRAEEMESLCALPLVSGGRCRGVLFFMAARRGAYQTLRRDFLDQVAAAVAVALDDCLAHEEVRRLRDRLRAENVYLQQEILEEHNFGEIIGRSARLQAVMARVRMVAPTGSTVLVLGETGTGKELVARAIHDRSARRERPLVKVNCAAISAGLVESELFGHVKGAFTGAIAARSGRFELADGGTIFLDEVGELPLDTQAKLLRVLQEQEFEPVGSSETRRVDVRVIAATNRDLEQAVAQGRFRSDLYFRINVFPIEMPPLRERPEDIPLLVHCFVERFGRAMGKRVEHVPREVMNRLTAYRWPGNVREMQNIIERAMVLTRGPALALPPEFLAETVPATVADSGAAAPASAAPASLEAVHRQHILGVLERCGWVIEGPRGAAHVLGMQPSTLRSRLKKLGLHQRPARMPS
jgi:formate hydrogenlyase transcriptional activator